MIFYFSQMKHFSSSNSLLASLFILFKAFFKLFFLLFFPLSHLFHFKIFIFHSVWLSFCHFVSPSVSRLLAASLSLPPLLPLSLHIFLSLSSSCSLLPAASHSPSHSFTQLPPCIPPSPVSFSLSAFSCPLLLLIYPSLFLYLSFCFFLSFFLFPLPSTKLVCFKLFPVFLSLPPLCPSFFSFPLCSLSALLCFVFSFFVS